MKKLFHASVEGAQHTPKGLDGFLKFAKKAGAGGCQPSNFMLEGKNGDFLPAEEIRQMFGEAGLKMDGISAHCPFWVYGTAWTGSKTIRPFVPTAVYLLGPDAVERWALEYILRLLNVCAELGVGVVPMFWGTIFGWEVASGYPWGFWKGPDYDLIAEGLERFVVKTEIIRERANILNIKLAHEIHPGTAAACAQDFLDLLVACDGDECLGVNADPSHCWEGEDWQTRFGYPLIANRIYGVHMKNHVVLPGRPLRYSEPDWKHRPMQFTALDRGDLDMVRYTEHMIRAGYAERYLSQMGGGTAPLVVEAEGAFEELDDISARGIQFVNNHCCFNVAGASFEDGMGDAGKQK